MPSVQILRGLAALLVLICHVIWGAAVKSDTAVTFSEKLLWRMGDFGVDIFFCISGFVIMLTRARAEHRGRDAATFLTARIRRIYPLYLFWLTVYLLGGLALKTALGAPLPFAYPEVSARALVRNYLLLPSPHSYFMHQAWTLSYEMYFYAAFALVLWLWGRRNAIWPLMAMLGSAFVLFTLIPDTPDNIYLAGLDTMLGDPLIWNFVLGALLAHLFGRKRTLFRDTSALTLFAAMSALAAVALMLPEDLPRLIRLGLPAAAILAMAIHATPAGGSLTKALIYLGEASYSIYITHIFFAYLAPLWVAVLPLPALAAGAVLAVLAAVFGCLNYEFLERRLQDGSLFRRRAHPDFQEQVA